MHFYKGTALRVVDWEPNVAVLDQEDLFAQGIDTSVLVAGAPRVNALGSCTANAGTEGLSQVLDLSDFCALTGATSFADTVGAEKFAIRFYHACTDQTGNTTTEWPPTDCGSCGADVVTELEGMSVNGHPVIAGDLVANGPDNIVSLMQSGGLIVGQEWFNAWMEPGPGGFIDGDGTTSAIQACISSGVAGGHETYWSAIEKVMLLPNGSVDTVNTIIRARNSWTKSWGDNGSYRFHLSTFIAISNYCDFRQFQPYIPPVVNGQPITGSVSATTSLTLPSFSEVMRAQNKQLVSV
jgi:hypothetical protein